jgi:hypothetical protein
VLDVQPEDDGLQSRPIREDEGMQALSHQRARRRLGYRQSGDLMLGGAVTGEVRRRLARAYESRWQTRVVGLRHVLVPPSCALEGAGQRGDGGDLAWFFPCRG